MIPRLNKKKIKQAFVAQHDSADCGAACLLSLIRYYNGDASLQKLKENAGTGKDGTTLLGLHQAAIQSGFDSQGYEADITDLIKHQDPMILHVVIDERLQHYVICYGYEDGKFIIGDPAVGVRMLPKKELDTIWVSRNCLALKPNKHFVQKETINRAKTQWILRIIREDYLVLLFSAIIGLFIATLGIVMSVFSQKLIDDILPSNDPTRLIPVVLLVATLLMFRVGLSAARQLLLLHQSRAFNNRIINAFYNTLLYLPKSFYDNKKIGELVARLNDTGRIQRVITNVLGGIVIDSLTILVTLSFIFFYSWPAAAMASISLPIYFLLVFRFNDKIVSAQQGVMQNYAKSESNFINTIQGVTTIKNRGKEAFFSKINQIIYGELQNKTVHLGKINVKLGAFSGLFGVVFLISILTYMSFEVFQGQMLIGKMMAVLGMLGNLLPAVSNLALVSVVINEARVAFDRMFEFINEPAQELTDKHKEDITFEYLHVSALSFRFPGRKPILKDISLEVNKGEVISIVGESGSGKSTLIQLLQNFYSPEEGRIIINGQSDLKNIKNESWKKVIGVVPQDIHLFNGTVLNNICFSASRQDITHALDYCKTLGFDHFINALPQGYGTLVGEEGINLSGGQKQIIALARALLHRPSLLILDEATASMDRITEKFVLDLLHKVKGEMAVIFVSHRLHLLPGISERIYVINEGTIENSGSHQELMLEENFYSSYWNDIQLTHTDPSFNKSG
ncbi:peptidase domain-containing ABC transporter [Fulvivirga sp. M361]|uniref:peptidase domain-containing ABC transporter n=1 Tax=Fulvivirga sp. M361 TaxID=2594266 RepID=UPI001C87E8FD|nr:peptidase domain-containing ABC transporter [Fulvivirga sp. M361]